MSVFRSMLLGASSLVVLLAGCDTADSVKNAVTGDDLPTGKWLSSASEEDEDGLVTTKFLCLTEGGAAYQLHEEVDNSGMIPDYDLSVYQGTYAKAAGTLSLAFVTRASFTGETIPTSADDFEVETLGTDAINVATDYKVTNDTLILGDNAAKYYSADDQPAYLSLYPCK